MVTYYKGGQNMAASGQHECPTFTGVQLEGKGRIPKVHELQEVYAHDGSVVEVPTRKSSEDLLQGSDALALLNSLTEVPKTSH